MLRFLTRKSKRGGEPLFASNASDKNIKNGLCQRQDSDSSSTGIVESMDSKDNTASGDAEAQSADVPTDGNSKLKGDTKSGEMEAKNSLQNGPDSDVMAGAGYMDSPKDNGPECGAGSPDAPQGRARFNNDATRNDDDTEGMAYGNDDIDAVLCITGIAHGGDLPTPRGTILDQPATVALPDDEPPKSRRFKSQPEITEDLLPNDEVPRGNDADTSEDFAFLKATVSDPNLYSNYNQDEKPLMLHSNLRGNKKGNDLRVSFWDEVGRRYGRRREGWGSDEDFLSVASTVSQMSESDYIPSRLLMRRTCALVIAWLCMVSSC